MFSYQLYSSRNFPPASATFAMLATAGYGAVEGYGPYYADDATTAETAALLAAHGLTMPTGHFSLQMLEYDMPRVLSIAKTLGMKRLYCPYIMPEDRPKDGPGWRAFGARLEKAGAAVKAAGLGFGWHNHDFEFIATPDGALPQDEIFAGGPSLEWEIDVAWVVRGGADPLVWIEKYKDRITSVHVKDIAPAGQNTDQDGWCDVGSGIVQWKQYLPLLRGLGVRHFIMEHDNPSDHTQFASRSIAAAKAF
jgi:sugar phosphate isomerase/epimerase